MSTGGAPVNYSVSGEAWPRDRPKPCLRRGLERDSDRAGVKNAAPNGEHRCIASSGQPEQTINSNTDSIYEEGSHHSVTKSYNIAHVVTAGIVNNKMEKILCTDMRERKATYS